MSRSFKKTPSFTNSGSNGRKAAKKQANVKTRHTPDIPDGMAYKKVFPTWDIDDYPYILSDPEYRWYVRNLWAKFEGRGFTVRWVPRFTTEEDVLRAIRQPRKK